MYPLTETRSIAHIAGAYTGRVTSHVTGKSWPTAGKSSHPDQSSPRCEKTVSGWSSGAWAADPGIDPQHSRSVKLRSSGASFKIGAVKPEFRKVDAYAGQKSLPGRTHRTSRRWRSRPPTARQCMQQPQTVTCEPRRGVARTGARTIRGCWGAIRALLLICASTRRIRSGLSRSQKAPLERTSGFSIQRPASGRASAGTCPKISVCPRFAPTGRPQSRFCTRARRAM